MNLRRSALKTFTMAAVLSPFLSAASLGGPIPFKPTEPLAQIRFEKHLYGYFDVTFDESSLGEAHAVFSSALWTKNDIGVRFALVDATGNVLFTSYMDAHMKASFGSHEEHRTVTLPLSAEQWRSVACIRIVWWRDNPPEAQALFDFPIGDSVDLQPTETCF
jgi:hypothetical protein